MKGLKITISTIIILLLLIFLVLPFGIGLWTKHSYKTLIENLPPTANVSVKLAKFDLGWFHSKAVITVDLHPQTLSPSTTKRNDIRIIFYNDIKQGPVIFSKKSNGANKTTFAFSQTAIRAPSIKLKSTTTWQFNNKIKSLFSSEQFELNLSGLTLEIKGLRGAGTYNVASKRWEGNANIDSGSLSSRLTSHVPSTTLVTFNDVAYSGKVRRVGLVGYGKQSISFSTLKIMSSHENQKNPVISNLTITSEVGQDEDTTNFRLTFDANKVQDSEFDVNSFSLNASVEGLNTNALNNLIKLSHTQSKTSNESTTFAKIAKASTKLFRQGFSFKLHQFYLGTSQGRVDLKGYLKLPKFNKGNTTTKVTSLATGELQLQVPKQWLISQVANTLSFLKGKKNNSSTQSLNQATTPSDQATTPSNQTVTPLDQTTTPANQTATPLEQATTMVQQWENDGYLLLSANNYISTINYKDGKLLINGKVPDFKKKSSTQPSLQPSNNTGQDTQ